MTLADLAFPGFVFTMGLSAAISFSRREPTTKKICRRTALMFGVGILYNALPIIFAFLLWTDFTAENFFDSAIVHGRLFGVLQRLALTYLFAVLLIRAIKSEVGIFATAIFLLILSSAGFHIYAPENPFDEAHNLSRAVDYIFPGANHIFTPMHDPEGLYGTFASTASMLFGFLAGKILLRNVPVHKKILLFVAATVAFLIAGSVWSNFDIVAKKLWTAPFALITSGVEFFLLAVVVYLLDKNSHAKNFFQPLSAIGMNPLFFYLASNIVRMFLQTLPSPVEGISLYFWTYLSMFYHLISPEFGSVIFCAVWCLLWLSLAKIFYRRDIVIKL